MLSRPVVFQMSSLYLIYLYNFMDIELNNYGNSIYKFLNIGDILLIFEISIAILSAVDS